VSRSSGSRYAPSRGFAAGSRHYAGLVVAECDYAFISSYDPALLAAFKQAVPESDRRFSKAGIDGKAAWYVTEPWGQTCADLAQDYLSIRVEVPPIRQHAPRQDTETLRVEYLGSCRDRGNGQVTATGFVKGDWYAVFSEQVLRLWFEGVAGPSPASVNGNGSNGQPAQPSGPRPTTATTFYAVLSLKPTATDNEIKSAYRRMAKIWHPDVNRGDPEAANQFKAVQAAYEALRDSGSRRKYDFALSIEKQFGGAKPKQNPYKASQEATKVHSAFKNGADPNVLTMDSRFGYRAPEKCGWVLAEGHLRLGQFVVDQVLGWQPITDDQGREMVSSWPEGAKMFVVNWV
jgi:hypothetical protein